MIDWMYQADLSVLYPVTALLIVGAAEIGAWLGRRGNASNATDISTLTGAALGLLALLLAFSFSLALSRFDARRTLVLEEANAIGSTANFALMLPETTQKPILSMLRDYTNVRIGLGVPYDPAKLERDITRSLDLQARLWKEAVAVTATAPQSLPTYRFVASLNEMNNIHESRLTALRYHVPGEVMFILIGVAMVAMGFSGYHAGGRETRGRVATLIMSLTVAVVIMLIVDLDRPARGFIEVSTQPLPGAHEVRVLPSRLAVAQCGAIERANSAAGRLEHRLRCAGVPLHRAAKARIQVGNTLGQPAKFHARTKIDHLRHTLVAQEIVEPRAAAVIATGQNREPFLRR